MPVELNELIATKINNLRPKLLDLSRRNPLISTKLTPRSNAHIRAVDELPDILFYKLTNAEEMTLLPLPSIEEDPRDEQTSIFRDALINARLVDMDYLTSMEEVDRDADDYIDRTRTIERQLKDRVRAQLQLAPRVQKAEVNLVQHAKNNGILPSYELPEVGVDIAPRHSDEYLQTLLLPNDFERKLNSILSKSRTWVQETGINVLQIAFGFLEWSEDSQSETSFAPLLLLPVEILKTRTVAGPKYSILATGDEIELNTVLKEKLRIDFSLELPSFEGSLESYFAKIATFLPRNKSWRVRRQVALGVFPSSRMAMYHDLDPNQPAFPQNPIVDSLLGGSSDGGASPFADEYNVDEPSIERKVSYLVSDADSSQFSALADIGDGKNLAIEGPPGTGKSQTIVNAIAAALGEGKKVLFVAEKLAALNVVKARLEAVGLGDFLLPLQAEKSTREQVMDSIRARLEMKETRASRDFEEKVTEFRRIRKQLADYIELITSEFQETGLTVYEILGLSIATNDRLTNTSADLLERTTIPDALLGRDGLRVLKEFGIQVENAHLDTLSALKHWQTTELLSADRFTIEAACNAARKTSDVAKKLSDFRSRLDLIGLDSSLLTDEIKKISRLAAECVPLLVVHSKDLLHALTSEDSTDSLKSFLDRGQLSLDLAKDLSNTLIAEFSDATAEKLQKIHEICGTNSLRTVDPDALQEQQETKDRSVAVMQSILAALKPLVDVVSSSNHWQLDDIANARNLVREAGREVLLLRDRISLDEKRTYDLRELAEEGLGLVARRVELETEASISSPVTVERLVECSAIFGNSGPFSFLSSSFRSAKKTFAMVAPHKKHSNMDRIRILDRLISFRRSADLFAKSAESSDVFGMYYRGLDTKFALFIKFANFIEAIEKAFGRPDQKAIAEALRTMSAKDLELIPGLTATGVSLTFTSLQDRSLKADAEARQLEASISLLKPLVGIFKTADTDINAIPDTISKLRTYIIAVKELDQDKLAHQLLGGDFHGSRTQFSKFFDIAAWGKNIVPHRSSLASILSTNIEEAIALLNTIEELERNLAESIEKLSVAAKINAAEVFLTNCTLPSAIASLESAASDADGLFKFASFAGATQDGHQHGVTSLLDDGKARQSFAGFSGLVEAAAVRLLARRLFDKQGTKLSRYKGSRLDELRRTLAEKDKEILQLSRRQLRNKIRSSARPPSGNGIGKKSTWTDMALIQNEISKKQRFISVRDLTHRAGRALSELKPCWMMSPLAVAQYVAKEDLQFDLCIIDEASQMPPESAIGALLRSKQAVVVGDTNQLPPSNFFKSVIDDEEADEDEVVLNESVLEMANGAFRPSRSLKWHYRSRHSALIKFSNRLIYDDRLIVFPSATESMARMGVEFRSVIGNYRAGTNPTEAKAMVESAIEFMTNDPERSLGIVTLNQKQRDLIREEFEFAVTNNRAVQKYVDTWKERNDGLEEFFVKNLENVQGDERDVIFIGTVYGPEQPGARVMQRFGPINGLAGKRRLNVLFTRAKQKIVTFSSMTASDVEAEEHRNEGVYMLKRWLEFAATGVLDAGETTEREPDSDFEAHVIQQIRSLGCEAVPQVGVAGYFVDIGIKHKDWAHGFILGVECDGATYHSAKSARDRDRLRQEILEGLGWQLHRIWSTDWFNNPRNETERMREVIANRLLALKAREREFTNKAPATPSEEMNSSDDLLEPAQRSVNEGASIAPTPASDERRVRVGDTVRVRYLSDDKRTILIFISDEKSDPDNGVIHCNTPIATALLGAEEGEEVEILVGSYIRPAIIESISEGN